MNSADQSNTAVLYFSLSPAAQAQEKAFASGRTFKTNVTIAQFLHNHTRRQIELSGLPFFVFDENNQTGGDFGEKIVNAFADVFSQGYDHVIAVGNDTPHLSSRHLTFASDLLRKEKSKIILGPAADGGTWLMGFNRDAFEPEILRSLPWNSSNLFSSILRHFKTGKNIEVLEYFDDVDQAGDLQKFLNVRPADSHIRRLHQTLIGLLSSVFTNAPAKNPLPFSRLFKYSFLLRGPPPISGSGHFTS